MSKPRVSNPKGRSRRRSVKSDVSLWLHDSLKKHHFVGISLGGGKTDKTCVAIVEYYPEHKKIFLSQLIDKIQSNGEVSADEILYQIVSGKLDQADMLALNVPLALPKCMRCELRCPGYEKCKEPEMQWLWKTYRERNHKKKPLKLFTPYTERCAEVYVSTQLEEPFSPPHALGSNVAPVTARAHFLLRRLKTPSTIEVYPRLSLWRIGRSMGIQKSYLRTHKHSIDGLEARRAILHQLMERNIAFIYDQDMKIMVESPEAFEAFLCAMTAVLKFKGQVEKPPRGYPRGEAWIEIPLQTIEW